MIIWPEAALPQLANEVTAYIKQLYARAGEHGSDIVMGILRADDNDDYHNSILVLPRDGDPTFYDKHHLVPFAEFFPVPSFVRSWLRLMNLPYSDFTPGSADQPAVAAAGTHLALGICYEDAYGTYDLAAVRWPQACWSMSPTTPGSGIRGRDSSISSSPACGRWRLSARCYERRTMASRRW